MLDFAKNYFDIFDIPKQFEINTKLLNERYLALQQVVHPDRHANASDQMRLRALQEASLLNEALRVLKNPILRAEYLLNTQDAMDSNAQDNTIHDPNFLMAHMELRETLAAAEQAEDPYGAIAKIMQRLISEGDDITKTLADSLEQKNYAQAKEALYKLKFIQKMRHNAEELEASLDDRIP